MVVTYFTLERFPYMDSVLERVDKEAEVLYQETVLLASLFNGDYMQHGICRPLQEVSEESYRHLVVKAFAVALGSPFEANGGSIIHATRDLTRTGWVRTILTLVRGDDGPMKVLTNNIEHSWLFVDKFDLWIDLLPPGCDVRCVTPVKYPSSSYRPGYTKGQLNQKSIPDTKRVLALSKHLTQLSKNKDPRYLLSFSR